MKTELEQLRKEFNERIDALLATPEENKWHCGLNKWYYGKSDHGDFIMRVKSFKGGNVYGPWMRVDRAESYWGRHAYTETEVLRRLATEEECQRLLIKEAERRGFKEGVMVHRNDAFCEAFDDLLDDEHIDGPEFYYYPGVDTLEIGGRSIYCKGAWAEIVKDPPLMIGSYEVQFFPDRIEVGCQSIPNELLKKIYEKQKP